LFSIRAFPNCVLFATLDQPCEHVLTQRSKTPHTAPNLAPVASQLTSIGRKSPDKVSALKDSHTSAKGCRFLQVLKQLAIRNRILRALPAEEFARIVPHLKRVQLAKDEIIYLSGDAIEHVYLLESGLVSLLSTTDSGSNIEVAMISVEGVVGLPIILKNSSIPYEVSARFPTEAFKLRAEIFQAEFDRGQALHEFVLRYLNVMITQIQQSSICARFHRLDETLSRWLLTVHDQVKTDTLILTQQAISNALGVPRTAVTVAAGTLQRGGAIRYSRGKITILDRERLEASSCECYRVVRDELHHFLNE